MAELSITDSGRLRCTHDSRPLTLPQFAALITDEASELADASTLPEICDELIDVLGYVEVALDKCSPLDRDLLRSALSAAIARHRAKCATRNRVPLQFVYSAISNLGAATDG